MNYKNKSTCEKLQELQLEKQLDILYEIIENRYTCLQCEKDTYTVVDREKTDDIISHTCLCTSCMDCIAIDMQRGTYIITNVSEVEIID